MKIEVRRMDNATWVKLNTGLAVVPIELLQTYGSNGRTLSLLR
jgi:hypothetical protein